MWVEVGMTIMVGLITPTKPLTVQVAVVVSVIVRLCSMRRYIQFHAWCQKKKYCARMWQNMAGR